MTTTAPVVIATGTRNRLHFGDYTEQFEQPTVTYWDGGSKWTVDEAATEPATAPDAETDAALRRYRDAVKWIGDRLWEHRPDFMFKVADFVEVFKGRKVLKGVYRVAAKDKSNYGGDVLTLLDAEGRRWNYVSADNCRRLVKPQPFDDVILGVFGDSSTFYQLLDYPTANAATGLGVLADRLEEAGHDEQATVLRRWAESWLRRALDRAAKYADSEPR